MVPLPDTPQQPSQLDSAIPDAGLAFIRTAGGASSGAMTEREAREAKRRAYKAELDAQVTLKQAT